MDEQPERRGYRPPSPERRGYSPASPARAATLPEAPQEFDQTVQNFIKQLEAEENAQFQVEGDKFVPQKFKSGQFRVGGEIPCKKIRLWPHDLCYIGVDCKRVVYDDLSPLQWMCGFTRSIVKNPSESARLNMLNFCSDFF